MWQDRVYLIGLGLLATLLALVMTDTVMAIKIAYNILIGGLLVSILGGLLWRRGTGAGALASMVVGSVCTLASMAVLGITAYQPIYIGLGASILTFIAVSLLGKPTDAKVLRAWEDRQHERVSHEQSS